MARTRCGCGGFIVPIDPGWKDTLRLDYQAELDRIKQDRLLNPAFRADLIRAMEKSAEQIKTATRACTKCDTTFQAES